MRTIKKIGAFIASRALYFMLGLLIAIGATYAYATWDQARTGGSGQLSEANWNEMVTMIQDEIGSGVPSGFCMFSDTQAGCPVGWTRTASFDERTIKGVAASIGTTGGSATHTHGAGTYLGPNHTHEYTEVVKHSHPVNPPNTTSSADGAHTHKIKYRVAAGGSITAAVERFNIQSDWQSSVVQSVGDHTHTVNIAEFTSGSTGVASATTEAGGAGAITGDSGSESSWSPYINVLICCKD